MSDNENGTENESANDGNADTHTDKATVVQNFPFNADDVWSLNKGDLISVAACEQASGVRATDVKEYRLALLRLREQLEKYWYEVRGEIITTTTEQDGIRIHSDDAAIGVNTRTLKITGRRIHRTAKCVVGIDASKVPPERLPALTRVQLVASAMLSGIRKEVRTVLNAYKRQTPASLSEKK